MKEMKYDYSKKKNCNQVKMLKFVKEIIIMKSVQGHTGQQCAYRFTSDYKPLRQLEVSSKFTVDCEGFHYTVRLIVLMRYNY